MKDNEIREASLRLQQDLKVVEACKHLAQDKFWRQLVSNYIRPSIDTFRREVENAARHLKGEEYYAKFWSCQGVLKHLDLLEDIEVLAQKHDEEIKGLKKLLENAKTETAG